MGSHASHGSMIALHHCDKVVYVSSMKFPFGLAENRGELIYICTIITAAAATAVAPSSTAEVDSKGMAFNSLIANPLFR